MITITPEDYVVDPESRNIAVIVGVDDTTAKPSEFPASEIFVGYSSCAPEDNFDDDFGYRLAYWRAIQAAANKNIRRLNGIIKHKDDVAEHRQAVLDEKFYDEVTFAIGELTYVDDLLAKNNLSNERCGCNACDDRKSRIIDDHPSLVDSRVILAANEDIVDNGDGTITIRMWR